VALPETIRKAAKLAEHDLLEQVDWAAALRAARSRSQEPRRHELIDALRACDSLVVVPIEVVDG
jgi:hypothetical protein